jgi:hypothetical protein
VDCNLFARSYTGDACEACAAAFFPHRRHCVSQWILGKNVFQAKGEDPDKHMASTVFLVIGTLVAVLLLVSMSWVLWRWLVLKKRPRVGGLCSHPSKTAASLALSTVRPGNTQQ